tara:strand:- start:2385 stop:4163 length:1779 start_codon:yes stop_codon:yes gene_type:complete
MAKPVIKYTNRDYASIRSELIEYVKKYYPDTMQDFNEASFGAMMLDLVAYVGDVLSFYLDYQANESFLSTAIERKNILKLAKQFGFKLGGSTKPFGTAAFYVSVQANANGQGPDENYLPALRQGASFTSSDGTTFTLAEDIDFRQKDLLTIVDAQDGDTGVVTRYALKAYGQVIGGNTQTDEFAVASQEDFLRLTMSRPNVTEIIKVEDSEGNEYFEVDYLSQNIIYKSIRNTNAVNNRLVPYLMREVNVPRRFIVDREDSLASLVFGYGSPDKVEHPRNIVLDVFGKNYVKDDSFDPARITESDKFGVAPNNTTMSVTYRYNPKPIINVPVGKLSSIGSFLMDFPNNGTSGSEKEQIRTTLEITNEKPILNNNPILTDDDIKRRAIDSFATQNRAVTKQDYISLCYRMDPKFGSVKRTNVVRDADSIRRNINIYTVSENSSNSLVETDINIKNNLRRWLNSHRMMNDTVDILSANIINIGIEFTAIGSLQYSKFDVLTECYQALIERFSDKLDIGNPFYITEIYKTLNALDSVIDTKDVQIVVKAGTGYASAWMDIDSALSADGRYIDVPEDSILEIKFLSSGKDLQGVVI